MPMCFCETTEENIRETFCAGLRYIILVCPGTEPPFKASLVYEPHNQPSRGLPKAVRKITMSGRVRFPLDLFLSPVLFPPPGDIQSDVRKSTESETSPE
jgi:hypothetical protein